MKKKIIDATRDNDGNICSVKFAGNSTYTPIDTAIRIAQKGGIKNAHVAKPKLSTPYLRSNPDDNLENNLSNMAKK
ncbi:DUF3892 domain-containing protein [Vibrio metschnikovii]|uniref:DUF3892 domain-containing protein n=1 Tax=Vibrio metschnikovii TaxID=28172 RepID=UPI001C311256|nr:DUF3892 domain-containing protein [Vibrio metschnikovii]